MDVTLLINAIVRQTTVLIAELATAGGVRAPLAHIANQVFLDLTNELSAQGVSRKVSADMFGMALRAYRKKIQRLTESSSVSGSSLWEAVMDHVDASPIVTRGQILTHFQRDDETLVRAILHDLVESGFASCSGTGNGAVYRVTSPEERRVLISTGAGLDEFLWVLIYRQGPVSTAEVERQWGVRAGDLLQALARLVAEGRVRQVATDRWQADDFYLPLGAKVGWEAAMFDHYQALVRTLSARLQTSEPSSADVSGGSTYTFEVWPGHPEEAEVIGTLARLRRELGVLRGKVEARRPTTLPEPYQSVAVYVGQCVTERFATDDRNDGDSTGRNKAEESSNANG